MTEFRIGNVVVGDGHPVAIIAEAACEHLGELDTALRMIDLAADAGVDVIKFQLHVPEEMIPGSIEFWGGSMDEVLERWNLPADDHVALMRRCEKRGIQYLCTPYSAAAAEALDARGIEVFKIGSGELTNIPMLRRIVRMGKPMVVATGMATIEEIDETVAALREESAEFMLMNCTSEYPAKHANVKLGLIPKLAERYGVVVGHSDHTPDTPTAIGAVAVGARVVEKHFTLDRARGGPDRELSLEPAELRRLVVDIRKVEAALGDEKTVLPEEQAVRDWAHHSVASVRDIPAGKAIEPDDVAVKRPGRGIPARHLEDVYGRVAARDVARDSPLQWEDLVPA